MVPNCVEMENLPARMDARVGPAAAAYAHGKSKNRLEAVLYEVLDGILCYLRLPTAKIGAVICDNALKTPLAAPILRLILPVAAALARRGRQAIPLGRRPDANFGSARFLIGAARRARPGLAADAPRKVFPELVA